MASLNAVQPDQFLAGRRIALVGRLASMSQRDAEKLIRQRGGRLAERVEDADWIVLGDAAAGEPVVLHQDAPAMLASDQDCPATAGGPEWIREAEFWPRLGLIDAELGVARLYTPAMLSGLLKTPLAAIRHWHRRGWLRATRMVKRLPYFDFEETCIARKLAALLAAGCSLSAIDRKLRELARPFPHDTRPLADPDVVVCGRCVYVRRDDGLAEPSGQLLIEFDSPHTDTTSILPQGGAATIPFAAGAFLRGARPNASAPPPSAANDLRALAAELEECGRGDQAIEVYRAILVSGQSTPEDHFSLAELLYRGGDLAAARERYYVAIEWDEDFVEARSNLGCVLAELGDIELAEAAFRGALEYHPHYADAHYHLARLLDRTDNTSEAAFHWKRFMEFAPASPWADEAQERLAQMAAP